MQQQLAFPPRPLSTRPPSSAVCYCAPGSASSQQNMATNVPKGQTNQQDNAGCFAELFNKWNDPGTAAETTVSAVRQRTHQLPVCMQLMPCGSSDERETVLCSCSRLQECTSIPVEGQLNSQLCKVSHFAWMLPSHSSNVHVGTAITRTKHYYTVPVVKGALMLLVLLLLIAC